MLDRNLEQNYNTGIITFYLVRSCFEYVLLRPEMVVKIPKIYRKYVVSIYYFGNLNHLYSQLYYHVAISFSVR